MTDNAPNRIDLSFLQRRPARIRIAVATAAFAAAGLAYNLLAPKWYQSVLIVVPVKAPSAGGISSLVGGDPMGMLASVTGLGGAAADAARIAAVLQSTAVTDAVIEKFDLRTRYGARYQESARESLWEHCSVKTLPKPNLVQLNCEDRDPRFAAELVGFFKEYGNQVFRRVGLSSASEEVRFLERRIVDLRGQADESASRLREFQEKHHIVDLESQARAVVSSVAALSSQRIAKHMELEYARSFATGDESGVRRLESQISVVDEQLRALEEAPDVNEKGRARRATGGGPGMIPAAMAVPKLRAEYERLYRDRKVAEATLVFALDRLEGARASEARDVSTFQVLDPPTIATRRSRPKLIQSVAIGALLGLAAGLVFEMYRARKVIPRGEAASP